MNIKNVIFNDTLQISSANDDFDEQDFIDTIDIQKPEELTSTGATSRQFCTEAAPIILDNERLMELFAIIDKNWTDSTGAT